MKTYPYLNDSSFLKLFDRINNKEQFIKITVLTFNDEKPIESIEGRVTGGNLNLDGNSSVRRNGSISIIADKYENDLTNVNTLLSINKKIELEIGFLNTTEYYKNFETIWFPLGVYVILNPSITHGMNGVNITLQISDKMCLLNGTCGGIIPASTTFHEYETINENGQYVILRPTIYQIIQELVNHFGGEQLGKIIISDVDTRIKKVMKWVGTDPLYIISTASGGTIQYSATTDSSKIEGQNYKIYEYGSDIGYIYTDFYYPTELIGDSGSTVCDILDQIKNMLGNYEYFYDIDGNFVFQEIKNYLNTSQAKVEIDKIDQGNYLMDMSRGKSVYTFEDGTLIQSYSNSPQYSMIKNDFVVWGIRKDAEELTYPIRYHLAIDEKPITQKAVYHVFFYEDPIDELTKAKCPMEYPSMSDFPDVGQEEVFYMDNSNEQIYKWDPAEQNYVLLEKVKIKNIQTSDWRTELYLQGSISEPLGTDSNYYYTELKNEWPKLYDVEKETFKENALKHPSDIDFFLDFIDSTEAISEFSVKNIGRRSMVVVDDTVNCIFEPEIPDLVMINSSLPKEEVKRLREECIAQGQDYIQVDKNIYSMITGGGTLNSAYNKVRELLYQYTSYNESVVITTLPIYYLEPNTRITIRDKESGIYGDYVMNTIAISFDIGGSMTISCIRALERI